MMTGAAEARAVGAWSIAAVIPVHNRERFIGRALESVLRQSRQPDAIIVVDDGSTDRTVEIVRSYGPRIQLIQHAHGGVSAARNAGVDAADSTFIAFLDSDDYWQPEHIERMFDAIATTAGKADMYFSDCRLEDGHGGGTFWELADFAANEPFEIREHDKEWLFLPVQPIVITAAAFKRESYLHVGGSDTTLVRRGDTHLIFAIGLSGPLCAVPGIAGTWTADASNSLTQQLVAEHPTYLDCTARLYADLLQRFTLPPEHGTVLRLRLAAAHYALARLAGIGRPREMLGHLGRALRLDPWGFWTRLGRRLPSRESRASGARR